MYGLGGELLAELDATVLPASQAVLREYVYLDGQPLAQLLPRDLAPQRPLAGGCLGAQTAAGEAWLWLAAVLLAALAIRSRRARPLAGLLVALWVVTCSGGGDPAGTKTPGGAARASGSGSGRDPIYYYHLDRLGTPIRMTSSPTTAGQPARTVWRAEYRPFGDFHRIELDPDGDRTLVENNLRFPGQFDDGIAGFLFEAGPYYNWHRYYSPSIGRYIQPDPVLGLGLSAAGGPASARAEPLGSLVPLRTPFPYAANAPGQYIDPLGLKEWKSTDGRFVCVCRDTAGATNSGGEISADRIRCRCTCMCGYVLANEPGVVLLPLSGSCADTGCPSGCASVSSDRPA